MALPHVAELDAAAWRRLNELLARGLELEPEARAAWLDDLTAVNQPLAGVLRQLLGQPVEDEGTEWLKAPLGAAGRNDAPGDHIGPYRLLSRLGEGGMGAVWLAERDDGVIQRQVALKLPLAEWVDRGLIERVARERSALASLNHPNIAQLYDAGFDGGRPYLALELVQGRRIDEWCAERRLGVTQRLPLALDVVRAVAQAHAQGVIHRDIKPANVLVTGEGRAKLLDFGIAKLLRGAERTADETELTRKAGRPFTLRYAAPEQLLGGPVSPAVDVYALGVLLYELLGNARPYGERATRHELERAIVEIDPQPPSRATADPAAARALRGDLDTIVLKALHKQPDERYPSAAELAADIERHLRQEPVLARPASRSYRLRRFLARHRIASGGVAAVLVTVAAGAALGLWQARQTQQQTQRARALNDFVMSVIRQADPAATQHTRVADLALLTAAEQRVVKELAGSPDLQLQTRLAIALAYRNRGDFQSARRTLRAAVDEASSQLDAGHLDLLRARLRAASWPLVDVANALAEVEDVVVRTRGGGVTAAPVLAEALLARHMLRMTTADAQLALADAREALALVHRHLGADHPMAIEASVALALVLGPYNLARGQDMLQTIEPAYLTAVDRGGLPRGHPEAIAAQATYALALATVGRADEGLKLASEGVVLARAHHGADSAIAESALATLGHVRSMSGDLKGAIDALREAHALASQREPATSLYRSQLAYELSWFLAAARRPAEALPVLREAAAARPSLPAGPLREGRLLWHQWRELQLRLAVGESASVQPQTEAMLRNPHVTAIPALANGLRVTHILAVLNNGETARAIDDARRLLAEQRSANAPGDHGSFLLVLARAQLVARQHAQALSSAQEAIDLQGRFRPRWLPRDADAHVVLGAALLQSGRVREARAVLERAHDFWREFDADSVWAAEAGWWLARALIADGESTRGRPLLASMRERLLDSGVPLLAASVAAADTPKD